MTRKEAIITLRGFIRDYKIDPHDAGLVLERVEADGVDSETLGDYLDGVGYPELAEVVYGYLPVDEDPAANQDGRVSGSALAETVDG